MEVASEDEILNIEISNYDIKQNIGIRIALVADLHDSDGRKAVEALKEIRPDYIMFAGDLWERQEETELWNHKTMGKLQTKNRWQYYCYLFTTYVLRKMYKKSEEMKNSGEMANAFLREAGEVATIFLSTGNHEWYYTEEDYKILDEIGAVLLDNSQTMVEINGKKLLIGGLSTRADLVWLQSFLDTKADYKILLSHHPEYVKRYVEKRGRADLIVSGHAHGGQWRIFGKIPIYAPGQGIFPKRTKGMYTSIAGTHIITAGCSNTMKFPRYGNPCEIVTIDL